MKHRKTRFDDGGVAGRFDEDTYARAKKFLRDMEEREGEGKGLSDAERSAQEASIPKPRNVAKAEPAKEPAKGASSPAPSKRAEIPGNPNLRGPSGSFEGSTDMGETERNIRNLMMAATGPLGRAVGAAPRVATAAKTALETAKGVSAPARYALKEGIEVAKSKGLKEGLETAKSTYRGMKNRFERKQAKEAGERKTAEAMERDKPILQNRPGDSKAKRLRRARKGEDDTFNMEGTFGTPFSRGGATKSSASKRADGCAVRGKTRGRMY